MITHGWVLAVDPGKKTGASLWQHNTEDEPPAVSEHHDDTFGAWAEEVCARFASEQLDIVCESFTITVQTAKKTQAPWSLEFIGVMRYLARKYGHSFVLQAPSSAKGFSSDDRLKQLGWWVPGLGHGNDASRHLLLYVAQRNWWSDRIAL